MQIFYFLALIQVFLKFFCLDLKKILVILFDYRSTFYHNTVRVLPLGTQSSRVSKGNTQKTQKFELYGYPTRKYPWNSDTNPTQPIAKIWFGLGITQSPP